MDPNFLSGKNKTKTGNTTEGGGPNDEETPAMSEKTLNNGKILRLNQDKRAKLEELMELRYGQRDKKRR